MNAKIKYGIIVIVLMVASFGGGVYCCNKTTTHRLEEDIAELSKRNKSITTRINDLTEASRRDAEASRILAEGIAELNKGLVEQIGRSKTIADRAQRINYLAGVLDKGITALIATVDSLQASDNSSVSSSSN